jgi:pimeloyl-ACP methyl ester carboxylesterase
VISPDRPGIGRSDPQPDRTVLGWARDVAELLDQIDVDRFAVMGWSMGGQYAAAAGYAFAAPGDAGGDHRGCVAAHRAGVFDELRPMDRMLTRMAQRAPWLERQWFRMMRSMARAAPTQYGRFAARSLGPADGAVIRDQGFSAFAATSREAARQLVEDYRAWARPWGFAPEGLAIPVDVWAGTKDGLVDSSWPRRLAHRIPMATLNIRDGGHFLAHRYYRETFDALPQGS